MNKILSQALKKAVSEYSPEVKEVPKDKRPDVLEIKHDPYVRIILTLCFIVLLMIFFKL